LRRTAPPRLGAGLPPRPRPRRRDPLRPQPVAVLVVVIGAAVPPAAHVPLAPFELELVPRVQPRSQLPRLVRTATPQCAAEVSHAITVVHAAAPPGVLTLVSGSGWLLGPAESFVAGVPLLVVESHDPSSVLGETLGRDRPSGIQRTRPRPTTRPRQQGTPESRRTRATSIPSPHHPVRPPGSPADAPDAVSPGGGRRAPRPTSTAASRSGRSVSIPSTPQSSSRSMSAVSSTVQTCTGSPDACSAATSPGVRTRRPFQYSGICTTSTGGRHSRHSLKRCRMTKRRICSSDALVGPGY